MSSCPNPAEVEAYLHGQLSEDQRSFLESHLESCSRCRELVVSREVELLLPDTSLTTSRVVEGPRSAAPGPEHRQQLGPYRVIEELGRGGQATVYLVEDTRLPRRLALKVFHGGVANPEHVLARFQREVTALLRLDHPGICTVHETGEWKGSMFIAMRYVEGGSLAQRIVGRAAKAGLPRQSTQAEQLETVRILEQTARALHVAHQAGIVHRDIKPSNILITRDGEPVIVDFGLARDDESKDPGLTRTGDLPGTPAYMSPEQLRGEKQGIDRRSDVFALGVTLYEALTLSLPFDAPTTAGTFRRILAGEWTPPSSNGRPLPKDLRVILATALEPDRARRYQTALALAEDLRRYRQREAILARPAGPGLRLRRWTQRNPVTAVSLLAVFLILLTALMISLALLERVRSESEGRAVALRRAEGTRLALESLATLSTNPGQALLLALEAAERTPSLAANEALLSALQASQERARLFGHTGWVSRIVFSADGGRVVTAGRDKTGRVWDSKTGRTLAILLGHDGPLRSAEFSSDGKRVLTAAEDATARIWDAETGTELSRLVGHLHGLALARYSPDGALILTVGRDSARVWDAATGQVRHLLDTQRGPMLCAVFDLAGARVATGSTDKTAMIWDVASGAALSILSGHSAALSDVRFSGDGRRLITAAHDGGVLVWDAQSGGRITELHGHEHAVRAAVLNDDGSLAATGGDDFRARIWDVRSGKERFVLLHDSRVTCLDLSPDGRLLLTACYDGKARVWSASSGRLLSVLSGHSGILIQAVFSPAGDRVATSSVDHTARIWSLHPSWPINATRALVGNPESACLDPRGERVAAVIGSALAEAQLLDLDKGPGGLHLAGHTGPITHLRFTPDGSALLSTSQDATARLWSAHSGELLRQFVGHAGPILGGRFSADGRRLATASEDRTVRVWDTTSGAELSRITGAQKACHVASLSPDGKLVICGSRDGSLLLAEAETGRSIRPLEDGHEQLQSVEWSPDGQRVVVANTTSQVRVRDPFTGASLGVLENPSRCDLALYSPDGRWIATTCHDLAVRLWDAQSLEETLVLKEADFIGNEVSFDAKGRWIAVYGLDTLTKAGLTGPQMGRLLLFPVDPLAEARRLRPGDLTPGERDRHQVGTAQERARFRAAWRGGEMFGSGD